MRSGVAARFVVITSGENCCLGVDKMEAGVTDFHLPGSSCVEGGGAIPCNVKREGGHSLVIFKGREGDPS